MRILVTGWFSFEDGEVTAGDLLARDSVTGWLRDAGIPHDTAVAGNFRQPCELDLRDARPSRYSHLLFVCGPAAGERVERLFARFAGCQRIAVGVSVVAGTDHVPVDHVLARDGETAAAGVPDLSLAAAGQPAPVVAVIRSHPQPEYGTRHRLGDAHAAIDRLLTGSGVAPVSLDTWLHPARPEVCSTPGQVESVLRRVDAVVTTRLHGLVLALKAGVPALAIDPVEGGGKISRQAAALGWPAVVGVDAMDDDAMRKRLAWCLRAGAREEAARRSADGRRRLSQLRGELLQLLAPGT